MSKNMMKLTLGLLAVGCMLATAGPAAATTMDSADFTWKYEMNVLPDAADIGYPAGTPDGNMDFTKVGSGGAATTDGNILAMTFTPSSTCYYDNNVATQTWQLDPNISYTNGYTYEVRLKVAKDANNDIAFLAATGDSVCAMLTIWSGGQSWGEASVSPISVGEQLDNTDDFHIFRVAQAPGATTYSVWRDRVLLSDSLGAGWDLGIDTISFGGWGYGYEGTFYIDYLRFTSGAHEPIPEPGTLALLATGLIGLLCYAWRKRK